MSAHRNGERRLAALVICAHLNSDRGTAPDRGFMQPSSGLQIASLIDRAWFDVRLYHEMWHGPLDTANLPDADIVFLNGLQKDFDRQRQLSYFYRRRGAITVAGGSICTLFPEFATRFFDVVCSGGVDVVPEIIDDYRNGRLRAIYSSPQTRLTEYAVDYRLLAANGIGGYTHLIESSRGCNFRCDFCVIPAEKARHTHYGTARVMRTIDDAIAASPRFSIKRFFPMMFFIDNNFGNNPAELRALCAALKRHPRVKAWGALVTQDVLRNRELIVEMARSKCGGLFTGLESLDPEFLKSHDKRQNVTYANTLLDDVAFAQRQGITITYGYLFDPRMSTVADMTRQVRDVLENDRLPFPSFFSFVAPLAGTKLFWESAERGELRPNVRLRDLEGFAVAYQRCSSADDEITAFARVLFERLDLVAGRRALLRKTIKMILATGWRKPGFWFTTYLNNDRVRKLQSIFKPPGPRTYIAGTDVLDPQYGCHPDDVSPEDKRRYFDPVVVTDEHGELAEWLQAYRPTARTASAAS
jgi:pyruvate-formate lyase-activating enzyme